MTNMDSGNGLEVLTLSLNGQAFALEASYVREILDLVPVTEVPVSNPFARGLINVRGKIVPLADLRYKLGMEERPPTIDTRVVVIEVDLDGDLTTIGLLAEKVHEVTSLAGVEMEENSEDRHGLAPRIHPRRRQARRRLHHCPRYRRHHCIGFANQTGNRWLSHR